MSTNYEWMNAQATVAYVPPGRRVDGEPGETEWMDTEFTTTDGALVLRSDEAIVLDGGPEAIRALLLRCLAALPEAGK